MRMGASRWVHTACPAGFTLTCQESLLSCSMLISTEQVCRIATLARLNLTTSEAASMTRQLAGILDYMSVLQQVDVSGVRIPGHCEGPPAITREDVPRASIPAEEALKNATDATDGFFVVPRVIDR